jgi:hypothetical protein
MTDIKRFVKHQALHLSDRIQVIVVVYHLLQTLRNDGAVDALVSVLGCWWTHQMFSGLVVLASKDWTFYLTAFNYLLRFSFAYLKFDLLLISIHTGRYSRQLGRTRSLIDLYRRAYRPEQVRVAEGEASRGNYPLGNQGQLRDCSNRH